MRLVLMSDTHENFNFEVPHGDILLHAGDFTYFGRTNYLAKFNEWLGDLPHKHKIVVPGNHEVCFEEDWEGSVASVSNATFLNQQNIEVMGLKIYGEPRQPRFYDWAFNVDRPDMQAVWEKVPTDIDVLVTHGPPYAAGDLCRDGRRVGCVHQRDWILTHQPQLVVCGHIHPAYGQYHIGNTLVVNAAIVNNQYKVQNKPVVIDL